MPLGERLFILCQHLLPHHGLSRLAGRLAEARTPWLKSLLIRAFVRYYGVDMQSAEREDPEAYENFNAFFTRRLKAHVRPLDDTPGGIASPADGTVSQHGDVEHGQLFQAKGHRYSLLALLGGDPTLAARFERGSYATVYLSPKDYHRVHMPVSGTLREMIHVPGRLFSVSPSTVAHVPGLFARNERVVCLFETETGPMAVVLVGAMIVASIETAWAGRIHPGEGNITRWRYGSQTTSRIHLNKGDELGKFSLGSTVIILFGNETTEWTGLPKAGSAVRMGELLGELPATIALCTPDQGIVSW